MPPDLPEELWSHIIELRPVERFRYTRRFARNLALTCKRLHQIATPFVYRRLSFYVNLDGLGDRRPQLAMTGLIRNLSRAQSLLRSPHLLRHVQQLALQLWDHHVSSSGISAYYFSPEGDLDNTQDAGHMISVIYDLITRLILHMPGLQELRVVQCPMTPLLYIAICSLPRLTSCEFSLHGSATIHEQSHPIDPPPILHIRKLRFDNRWANGYVCNILAGSITSLHTLSIAASGLPLLASYICNRALPLKTLQVGFQLYNPSADPDVRFALWDTLRATPEIRRLIIGGRWDVPPPDDLCDHLRNLHQLCASQLFTRKLATGAELDAIEITGSFHISKQSIAQVAPCSPIHLRVLSLHEIKPRTQQELDKFVHSFQVFQNLKYLDINYRYPDTPAMDVDFHESWKVIKNLWQKLKHLHCFNLHGFDYSESEYEEPSLNPYGIEVACPLDINDELLPRGHPTLERIGVSFFRRTLWNWDPEHGWVSCLWSRLAWRGTTYSMYMMSWNLV